MPVRVEVPIRIRVDPLALSERQDDLEEALAAAVGRALKNSRDVVLAQRGGYVGVRVHPPEFTWNGNGLIHLPVSTQIETETRIGALLAQLTEVVGIYEFMRVADSAPVPLPEQIEEAIAQDRHELTEPLDVDQSIELYAVPSYQDEGKKLVKLSVEGSSQSSAKLTRSLEEFIQSMVARLTKGDEFLFLALLSSTRSDTSQGTNDSLSLRALKKFAQSQPTQFRKLLLKAVTKSEQRITEIWRTENDIKYIRPENEDPLDIITDVVRVAQQIPEGKWLLSERRSKAQGVQRLIGLVNVLIEARKKLQTYLEKSSEKTDAQILQSLSINIEKVLPALEGLIVVIAEKKDAQKLFDELEKDLIEHIRWINYIQEKVKEIDVQISLYQILYGDSSNKLDEVAVLRQARGQYLQQTAENFLPTITGINAFLKESNDFYTNWRGTVAIQKLPKFKKATEKIRQLVAYIESSSKTVTSVPIVYAKFFQELPKLKHEVYILMLEIENPWPSEEDGTYKNLVAVQDLYPKFTSEIEQKIFVVNIKAQLFDVWNTCLQIEFLIREQKLGISISRDDTTQKRWLREIESIRKGVEAQYEKTNLTELQGQATIWQQQFKGLDNDIKSEERIKLYIKAGITIVAGLITLFLTAGTSGGLVIVAIQEAFVFTVTSALLESALLKKTFTSGELVTEFAQNVLMFGAFRILNKGILAGAGFLASGRPLAQFSIIMSSNALVATGFPLLITKLQKIELLEDGKLPEETSIQIISSLLLIAIAGIITGPKQLTELKAKAARQDILSKLMNIHSEHRNWLVDLDTIVEKGGPDENDFEAAKARGQKIYSVLKEVLSRMASKEFTDEDLIQLGYDRTQVLEYAELAENVHKILANATYIPRASSQKLLPPPNQVLNSLVPTSSGSYEYNPSSPASQPNLITTRLKSAGYDVTDNGGGVLRLTAPKGKGPSYLLLPAAQPGEPTFGRTLLERATGWRPSAEMAEIKTALEQINPNLIKTLEGEFLDETALATLDMLIGQRAKIQNKWGVDAVRGLAEMLRLERGITRATVQRLFERLPSEKLSGLFEKYRKIATSPKTKTIASLLVEPGLPTSASEFLIDVCHTLEEKTGSAFRLPDNMSRRAVLGLIKLVQDNPGDYVQKLLGVTPVKERLPYLESLVTPEKVQPLGEAEKILKLHGQDIEPGFNLLNDSSKDLVERSEKLTPQGGFSGDARDKFLEIITNYQSKLRGIQSGKGKTDYGSRHNLIGIRREIIKTIAILKSGATVWRVGPQFTYLEFDPSLMLDQNLPFKLTNTPQEFKVQLDVGATINGEILLIEEGGALKLPEIMKPLIHGGTIDIIQVKEVIKNDKKNGPSTRKFWQMLRLSSASKYATGLINGLLALGGQKVPIGLPRMEISVPSATADAILAAEKLGFKVVITGEKK